MIESHRKGRVEISVLFGSNSAGSAKWTNRNSSLEGPFALCYTTLNPVWFA
jgi:hypothetical protein